jgi:tetratricopeptide (TPR) repeat protein
MKLKLLSFIVSLVFNYTFGQSPSVVFENANTAYNNAKYEKAVSLYKEILDQGEQSAALYYNLANCYYRLNNVGESVFYYEKAQLLNPNDQDIKVNAAFAQNMAIDAVELLPQPQLTRMKNSFFNSFSTEGWAVLGVILAWFCALFTGLYLWNKAPVLKRTFFILAILSSLLLISSISISFMKSSTEESTTYGILFSEKIDVWAEPNSRSEVLFLIHEGTKVQLLDALQEWQKIKIANGSEGWIKGGVIRSLKDFK